MKLHEFGEFWASIDCGRLHAKTDQTLQNLFMQQKCHFFVRLVFLNDDLDGFKHKDLNLIDIGLGLDSKIQTNILQIVKNVLKGQTDENHRGKGLGLLRNLLETDKHRDNIVADDFEILNEWLQLRPHIGFVFLYFLLLNI